jgi:short subunit dehydrogenase-like uncharacterized protein
VITVYGATGFTGRQASVYLAKTGVPLAIAGRSRAKLEALAGTLGREVRVIVADADDPASIDAMVAQSRVIASFAGPFQRYSDAVVAACVARKVDYVDITGESAWVRTLIDRFHDRAAADGTKIVPFCGFDSVPSDLGAWAVVDWIRRTWQQPTAHISASYAVRGGGWNGGTIASALLMGETGAKIGDPALLNPPDRRTAADRRPDRTSTTWDEHRKRYLAPFVMASVNTRVVRRSAALSAAYGEPYGDGFAYDEAMEVKRKLVGVGIGVGLAAFFRLVRTAPGRSLVRKFTPAPGEGPSEAVMDAGAIRVRFVAAAADGREADGTFAAEGDAGNRVTVRICCECALALALQRDALPGGSARGGILTSATAFGPVLADRLRAVGTTIEVKAR